MTRASLWHDVRSAAAVTLGAALGATALVALYVLATMIYLLHFEFGLPVATTIKKFLELWPLGQPFAGLTFASLFFWMLSSWRLPLLISFAGLILLGAAIAEVEMWNDADRWPLGPILALWAGIGVLFLRFVDRSWQRRQGNAP